VDYAGPIRPCRSCATLSNSGRHMTTERELEDPPEWTEPAPEPLTVKEWLVYALVFFVLYLEFRYMWTWCRWFTACAQN